MLKPTTDNFNTRPRRGRKITRISGVLTLVTLTLVITAVTRSAPEPQAPDEPKIELASPQQGRCNLNVALTIDSSGSMEFNPATGQRGMDGAATVAHNFIDEWNTRDIGGWIRMARFGTAHEPWGWAVAPASDPRGPEFAHDFVNGINRELENLPWQSQLTNWQAAVGGVRGWDADVVIVLTDGVPTYSQPDEVNVARSRLNHWADAERGRIETEAARADGQAVMGIFVQGHTVLDYSWASPVVQQNMDWAFANRGAYPNETRYGTPFTNVVNAGTDWGAASRAMSSILEWACPTLPPDVVVERPPGNAEAFEGQILGFGGRVKNKGMPLKTVEGHCEAAPTAASVLRYYNQDVWPDDPLFAGKTPSTESEASEVVVAATARYPWRFEALDTGATRAIPSSHAFEVPDFDEYEMSCEVVRVETAQGWYTLPTPIIKTTTVVERLPWPT